MEDLGFFQMSLENNKTNKKKHQDPQPQKSRKKERNQLHCPYGNGLADVLTLVLLEVTSEMFLLLVLLKIHTVQNIAF